MLARGLLSLKGEVTVVLITNRPSFAALADRVLTIVDGTFIEYEPVRPRIESAARSAGVVA
jgi:ABC-type protease/lipase transport system fused ATPase/permease subunit